jgi:hypothetical protein
MGLPKKNIEKKNIFRENHVEVRRFDGTLYIGTDVEGGRMKLKGTLTRDILAFLIIFNIKSVFF